MKIRRSTAKENNAPINRPNNMSKKLKSEEKHYTEVTTLGMSFVVDMDYNKFIEFIKPLDFLSFKESEKRHRFTVNKNKIDFITIMSVENFNMLSHVELIELDIE